MTLPTCKVCLPEGLLEAAVTESRQHHSSPSTAGGDDDEEIDAIQWLVGWNPRGFVVCLADILSAPSAAEVQTRIETLEQQQGRNGGDFPLGLRVLGRLVYRSSKEKSGGGGGSSEFSLDDSTRTMRQKADIWLELDPEGPVLTELFCCGFKYPSQLHVIYHDGNRDNFKCTPHNVTVCGRWGLKGLMRLCDGVMPKQPPTAVSSLEGPILPFHCPQAKAGGSGMLSFPPRANSTPPLQLSSSLKGVSSGGQLSLASPDSPAGEHNDSFGNDSLSNSPVKGSFVREAEAREDEIQRLKEHVEAQFPQKDSCPPRLDYDGFAETTEFASILRSINAGYTARQYFHSPEKARSSNSESSNSLLVYLCTFLIWTLTPLLDLFQFVGRLSYIGRLSELRLRELLNALSLMAGTSKSCGLHPVVPHLWEGTSKLQRFCCLQNYLTCLVVDVLLGIGVSYVLVANRSLFFNVFQSYGYYGLHEMHLGYIDWFLGWPGGFKMNESLNQLLGFVSMSVLHGWQWLSQVAQEIFLIQDGWLDIGYSIAIIGSCFGISTFFAIVADATNLSTLHVRNLAHLFGLGYRGFLTVLSTLVGQFRGKRYNPLRKRADDGEFAIDEVLLGTLICTLTMFIFPTVALYYYYLTVVRTSVWVVQEGMQGMSLLTMHLPIGRLVGWLLYRNRLPSGVFLGSGETVSSAGNAAVPSSPSRSTPSSSSSKMSSPTSADYGGSPTSPTHPRFPLPPPVMLRLNTSPMALSAVFIEFVVILSVVGAALRPRRLVNFIIHAKHKPKLDTKKQLYPHLSASCVNPHVVLPLRSYES